MGMAMVKPNCPTKASDPQTEGGCFFFMSSLLPLALVICRLAYAYGYDLLSLFIIPMGL
jgi:hypothetical protein